MIFRHVQRTMCTLAICVVWTLAMCTQTMWVLYATDPKGWFYCRNFKVQFPSDQDVAVGFLGMSCHIKCSISLHLTSEKASYLTRCRIISNVLISYIMDCRSLQCLQSGLHKTWQAIFWIYTRGRHLSFVFLNIDQRTEIKCTVMCVGWHGNGNCP